MYIHARLCILTSPCLYIYLQDKRTALHLSCLNNNIRMAKFLLSHNANVKSRDKVLSCFVGVMPTYCHLSLILYIQYTHTYIYIHIYIYTYIYIHFKIGRQCSPSLSSSEGACGDSPIANRP